jgi:glycosyltransferase involved in cell wall biosynthesis
MGKNIGFVSTRFAGIDGVSLEASKWADVLEDAGHECFWFAGELDRGPQNSYRVPEAHFQHPSNIRINAQVFGKVGRYPSVTDWIHNLRSHLKVQLQHYIKNFNLDLIIIENALSIPLHLPLGIALAELVSETQIPTIAHHHDLYWERINMEVNAVGEYLRMAFPPNLPNIKHVVINSTARDELARRRGILATIIPNVLDFENPPIPERNSAKKFQKSFGLKSEEKVILQPTRIIRRKGIERTIDLVKCLNIPACKMLISHAAGDEGFEYADWIKLHAQELGVDLRLTKNPIFSPWHNHNNQSDGCSLWSVYHHADFISYPSLYEGFGNAFLEAIYFRKPIVINRYAIFVKDIEPKGFDLISFDGYLTNENIQAVKEIMDSPTRREKMVNANYEIAKQHYSYDILIKHLNSLSLGLFDYSDTDVIPIYRSQRPEDANLRDHHNLVQVAG